MEHYILLMTLFTYTLTPGGTVSQAALKGITILKNRGALQGYFPQVTTRVNQRKGDEKY
jgi:hypothetical protein